MKKAKYIILSLFICITGLAQEENPLDYFPHHEGDIWQYYQIPGGIFTERTITNIDTIENNRLRLLYYNNQTIPSFKIDADSSIVYYTDQSGVDHIWYKLDVPLKTVWERFFDEEWLAYAEYWENEMIFTDHYFDVKVFYKYFMNPPDSNLSWPGTSEYLAHGIGFWKDEWEGGKNELIGCRINGNRYGTLVEIKIDNTPIYEQKINCYPNPFNSFTVLNYSLHSAGKIQFVVYNILGKKVDILFEGYKDTGEHNLVWNPKNIASGLYLAVLITEDLLISKKIIYLK